MILGRRFRQIGVVLEHPLLGQLINFFAGLLLEALVVDNVARPVVGGRTIGSDLIPGNQACTEQEKEGQRLHGRLISPPADTSYCGGVASSLPPG